MDFVIPVIELRSCDHQTAALLISRCLGTWIALRWIQNGDGTEEQARLVLQPEAFPPKLRWGLAGVVRAMKKAKNIS